MKQHHHGQQEVQFDTSFDLWKRENIYRPKEKNFIQHETGLTKSGFRDETPFDEALKPQIDEFWQGVLKPQNVKQPQFDDRYLEKSNDEPHQASHQEDEDEEGDEGEDEKPNQAQQGDNDEELSKDRTNTMIDAHRYNYIDLCDRPFCTDKTLQNFINSN